MSSVHPSNSECTQIVGKLLHTLPTICMHPELDGRTLDIVHSLKNTPVVWLSFLGSWIINEFENLGKQGSLLGKQNLRVTCPTGKVELKYFSSPEKCEKCSAVSWDFLCTSLQFWNILNGCITKRGIWRQLLSFIYSIRGMNRGEGGL